MTPRAQNGDVGKYDTIISGAAGIITAIAIIVFAGACAYLTHNIFVYFGILIVALIVIYWRIMK